MKPTYPDSYVIRNAIMWLMETADNWAQLDRAATIALRVSLMADSMREEHEHLTASEAGAAPPEVE